MRRRPLSAAWETDGALLQQALEPTAATPIARSVTPTLRAAEDERGGAARQGHLAVRPAEAHLFRGGS
jgi:hypothetical protein